MTMRNFPQKLKKQKAQESMLAEMAAICSNFTLKNYFFSKNSASLSLADYYTAIVTSLKHFSQNPIVTNRSEARSVGGIVTLRERGYIFLKELTITDIYFILENWPLFADIKCEFCYPQSQNKEKTANLIFQALQGFNQLSKFEKVKKIWTINTILQPLALKIYKHKTPETALEATDTYTTLATKFLQVVSTLNELSTTSLKPILHKFLQDNNLKMNPGSPLAAKLPTLINACHLPSKSEENKKKKQEVVAKWFKDFTAPITTTHPEDVEYRHLTKVEKRLFVKIIFSPYNVLASTHRRLANQKITSFYNNLDPSNYLLQLEVDILVLETAVDNLISEVEDFKNNHPNIQTERTAFLQQMDLINIKIKEQVKAVNRLSKLIKNQRNRENEELKVKKNNLEAKIWKINKKLPSLLAVGKNEGLYSLTLHQSLDYQFDELRQDVEYKCKKLVNPDLTDYEHGGMQLYALERRLSTVTAYANKIIKGDLTGYSLSSIWHGMTLDQAKRYIVEVEKLKALIETSKQVEINNQTLDFFNSEKSHIEQSRATYKA